MRTLLTRDALAWGATVALVVACAALWAVVLPL